MASKKQKLKTEEGQETETKNWDGLPQEVLNMIFNHLPVADLLSCSAVSKNWKKASRDVLKRGRECYAYIKDFPQDVQDLNDMMASEDFTQMFNGLNIQIKPGDDDGGAASQHKFSRSFAGNILQFKETRQKLEKSKLKLQAVLSGQWKYLKLDMGDCWRQVLSVDDALLLRELISATSESLEKLKVGQDLDCGFMSPCGKGFSKLKALHSEGEFRVDEDTYLEQFVQKYVPNLEEITGALHVGARRLRNPVMLKRMKSIVVCPDHEMLDARLMEGFQSVSGLHQLALLLKCCRNDDEISILFSMVLRSSNTLVELHMCTSEFYKLFMAFDELKFPNLRRLSLYTNFFMYEHMPIQHEISALKLLNLPKLCPDLELLQLHRDDRETFLVGQEEVGNPFEGPYKDDQSDKPIKIEYDCPSEMLCGDHFEFFKQIYPKMSKLQVLKWRPDDNYEMNRIFSDLHSLEYLQIDVVLQNSFYDPDPDVAIAAILLGINIQEAEFLFSEHPRENAKWNPCIVPIRPSLFNAKNLKELKITGRENYSGNFVGHSWVIEITENLPVRYVRKLEVTFEGMEELYKRLNDLKATRTLLSTLIMGTKEPAVCVTNKTGGPD